MLFQKCRTRESLLMSGTSLISSWCCVFSVACGHFSLTHNQFDRVIDGVLFEGELKEEKDPLEGEKEQKKWKRRSFLLTKGDQ